LYLINDSLKYASWAHCAHRRCCWWLNDGSSTTRNVGESLGSIIMMVFVSAKRSYTKQTEDILYN